MTIRAAVSSGRSEAAISLPAKDDSASPAGAVTVSTGAGPPAAAGLKAAVRTVITFFGSVACTVSIAFPA